MSKLFFSFFTFFTTAETAQIHWLAFASKSMSIVRQRLSFRRLCRTSPALSQRESPSAPPATLDGVELGEQISTTVSLLLFQPRQNMWWQGRSTEKRRAIITSLFHLDLTFSLVITLAHDGRYQHDEYLEYWKPFGTTEVPESPQPLRGQWLSAGSLESKFTTDSTPSTAIFQPAKLQWKPRKRWPPQWRLRQWRYARQ